MENKFDLFRPVPVPVRLLTWFCLNLFISWMKWLNLFSR